MTQNTTVSQQYGACEVKTAISGTTWWQVYRAINEYFGEFVWLYSAKIDVSDKYEALLEQFIELKAVCSQRITTISDVFVHESSLCWAVSLVNGQSVGDVWRKGDAYTIENALAVVLSVCQALSHAHTQDVLQQPDQAFCTTTGGVQLLNLGAARRLAQAGVVGLARDALAFQMQASKPQASPKSDLYSLAATLFTMLSGQLPTQPGLAHALGGLHLAGRHRPGDAARPQRPPSQRSCLVRATAHHRPRPQRCADAGPLAPTSAQPPQHLPQPAPPWPVRR
jgi:hypothetical protein